MGNNHPTDKRKRILLLVVPRSSSRFLRHVNSTAFLLLNILLREQYYEYYTDINRELPNRYYDVNYIRIIHNNVNYRLTALLSRFFTICKQYYFFPPQYLWLASYESSIMNSIPKLPLSSRIVITTLITYGLSITTLIIHWQP